MKPPAFFQNSVPIWFPHCPACRQIISLGIVIGCRNVDDTQLRQGPRQRGSRTICLSGWLIGIREWRMDCDWTGEAQRSSDNWTSRFDQWPDHLLNYSGYWGREGVLLALDNLWASEYPKQSMFFTLFEDCSWMALHLDDSWEAMLLGFGLKNSEDGMLMFSVKFLYCTLRSTRAFAISQSLYKIPSNAMKLEMFGFNDLPFLQ